MVRIWQLNSPYHTKVNKSIPSSSVDNEIPLAVKVALATSLGVDIFVGGRLGGESVYDYIFGDGSR